MQFSKWPIWAVIRSKEGLIVDLTERVAEAASVHRRDVIGKHSAAVWPGSHEFLALDRRALAQPKVPLTTLEYSHGGGIWLRSTRTVDRGRVVWVGGDASAEVAVAARRALRSANLDAPVDPRLVHSLLNGSNAAWLADTYELTPDALIRVLAQLGRV